MTDPAAADAHLRLHLTKLLETVNHDAPDPDSLLLRVSLAQASRERAHSESYDLPSHERMTRARTLIAATWRAVHEAHLRELTALLERWYQRGLEQGHQFGAELERPHVTPPAPKKKRTKKKGADAHGN